MDELSCEIARLQAALLDYDRVLPCAEVAWREQLLFHRNWDLAVLADLTRQAYGADKTPTKSL
jgi:hypothetical protein